MPHQRRHLNILFADKPDTPSYVLAAWLRGETPDSAFDRGCDTGQLFDRDVLGMWIIDETTGHPEVRRVHGKVPPEIARQHEAFLAQTDN